MGAFDVLSPHDFEKFVRDLLQAEWGVRLESFSPGKDGGTDLRLLSHSRLKTIQCKHYPNAALSSVQGKLKAEARRIGSKKMGEYWLATSARASPASKESTASVFSTQGLRPERILAEEDLKNILADHSEVLRSHLKLYLSDVDALQAILNNAIHSRQEYLRDRIADQLKYFVTSDAVAKVGGVLKRTGACIVTGPPGVGKTSLAESIAAAHAVEGYEIFEVFSAREVETVWKSKAKQFFLYDDFLGQTGLVEKLDRGEDRSLDFLFKRIAQSGTHKLILTTREYILTAARGIYGPLNNPPFIQNNVIVDVSQYSAFQKAHILYNHIYYSDLRSAARRSVQSSNKYLSVIRHPNYNPRLIESIISAAVAAGGSIARSGFADFLLRSLESPDDLWRSVFKVELSESQRALALLAGTTDFPQDREDLLSAAGQFLNSRGVTAHAGLRDLEVLEGIFVNIDLDEERKHAIRPKNPGIRDFLIGCLLEDATLLRPYLSNASPRAVRGLLTLLSSRGASASRPWRDAEMTRRSETIGVISEELPALLSRFGDSHHSARVVLDVHNVLVQSDVGIQSGKASQLVQALRIAVGTAAYASDLTDAYVALLPLMSEGEAQQIVLEIRRSWGDGMDIDDIPAALKLERAVGGDLVEELEYRLVASISVALDDYESQGFYSRSDMLDAVSGYLDWVEGDVGDIPDRIEEMRQAEWEPDDDDAYDRYRDARDASAGSMDDIHLLFGSLA